MHFLIGVLCNAATGRHTLGYNRQFSGDAD